MHSPGKTALWAQLVALLASAACTETLSLGDYRAAASDAALDGASDADAANGSTGDAVVDPSRDAESDSARGPLEVTCNQRDDDENGLVDDVDRSRDGVCDCLRIATLGAPTFTFSAATYDAWLAEQGQGQVVALQSNTLTESTLSGLQLIIVHDVATIGRSFSTAEISALASWVEAGGGLLSLAGFGSNDPTNVNMLLAPSGLRYRAEGVLLDLTFFNAVAVQEWLPHPISAGVSSLPANNANAVNQGGTVVARQGMYDMLRVTSFGKGRVAAWGDEWIVFDSQWSTSSHQVRTFWQNLVRWLVPSADCTPR